MTKTLVIAGEPRVTTTASGQRGAMLRAYNKATGKDEGAVYMPAPQSGSPMTYMSKGKHTLSSPSAAAITPGMLLAFRLPD